MKYRRRDARRKQKWGDQILVFRECSALSSPKNQGFKDRGPFTGWSVSNLKMITLESVPRRKGRKDGWTTRTSIGWEATKGKKTIHAGPQVYKIKKNEKTSFILLDDEKTSKGGRGKRHARGGTQRKNLIKEHEIHVKTQFRCMFLKSRTRKNRVTSEALTGQDKSDACACHMPSQTANDRKNWARKGGRATG